MRPRFSSSCPTLVGRLRMLCSGLPVLGANGQSEATDAALRDRVLQLVERLDAPKPEARDAAMASLTKLGPKILPILPDTSKLPAGDRKDRIEHSFWRLGKSRGGGHPAQRPVRVTLEGRGSG